MHLLKISATTFSWDLSDYVFVAEGRGKEVGYVFQDTTLVVRCLTERIFVSLKKSFI